MLSDTKEPLKEQWKKEVAVRKEAHRWEILSDAGFIGLVATEIPTFFAKESAKKSAWRLPLFVASSTSIVLGVVMSWIKGSKADALRESILATEHSHGEQDGEWGIKMATQQDSPPRMGK